MAKIKTVSDAEADTKKKKVVSKKKGTKASRAQSLNKPGFDKIIGGATANTLDLVNFEDAEAAKKTRKGKKPAAVTRVQSKESARESISLDEVAALRDKSDNLSEHKVRLGAYQYLKGAVFHGRNTNLFEDEVHSALKARSHSYVPDELLKLSFGQRLVEEVSTRYPGTRSIEAAKKCIKEKRVLVNGRVETRAHFQVERGRTLRLSEKKPFLSLPEDGRTSYECGYTWVAGCPDAPVSIFLNDEEDVTKACVGLTLKQEGLDPHQGVSRHVTPGLIADRFETVPYEDVSRCYYRFPWNPEYLVEPQKGPLKYKKRITARFLHKVQQSSLFKETIEWFRLKHGVKKK